MKTSTNSKVLRQLPLMLIAALAFGIFAQTEASAQSWGRSGNRKGNVSRNQGNSGRGGYKPTQRPSYNRPTQQRPTQRPSYNRPTQKPTTQRPTQRPGFNRPTQKPTTQRPGFNRPTTQRPTKWPNQKPALNRPTQRPTQPGFNPSRPTTRPSFPTRPTRPTFKPGQRPTKPGWKPNRPTTRPNFPTEPGLTKPSFPRPSKPGFPNPTKPSFPKPTKPGANKPNFPKPTKPYLPKPGLGNPGHGHNGGNKPHFGGWKWQQNNHCFKGSFVDCYRHCNYVRHNSHLHWGYANWCNYYPTTCHWWYNWCGTDFYFDPTCCLTYDWYYCPVKVNHQDVVQEYSWHLGVNCVFIPGRGLGIQEVQADSPAGLAGLTAGMVIVQADGVDMTEEDLFTSVLEQSTGLLELGIIVDDTNEVYAAEIEMTQVASASGY